MNEIKKLKEIRRQKILCLDVNSGNCLRINKAKYQFISNNQIKGKLKT